MEASAEPHASKKARLVGKACEKALIFEYESAANPVLAEVPVEVFLAERHQAGPSGIVAFDTSQKLETANPATTPNLLASFIRIVVGETVVASAVCTSSIFYVLRGTGTLLVDGETMSWQSGDLLAMPGDVEVSLTCTSAEEHDAAALYWVHDSPLLDYLGVVPVRRRIEPMRFDADRMKAAVEEIRHSPGSEHKNRVGILLASPAMAQTLTLSHTLWSLLNVLPHKPPRNVQRPHRHNSVALDLCVSAPPGKCYTLMGRALDAQGNIIDPVKVVWSPGSCFITPPGWWHSHHNEGTEDAWVLPIQDAGLLTHQRVLDIRFVDEEVARLKAGVARGATTEPCN